MGFRAFTLLCMAAVIIGLCMVYVPSCKPPDMSDCTWSNTTNRYDCPEDK